MGDFAGDLLNGKRTRAVIAEAVIRALSDLIELLYPGSPGIRGALWNVSCPMFLEEAMPAAYSLDLRERVVTAVEEGLARQSVARLFKVGISTVNRWAKRLAQTGGCAALPSGGDHKSKTVEAHKDWLLNLVNTVPDLTLEEIRARVRETHGLEKSISCLWRFFDRHDVTFKKNPSRRRTGPAGRKSRSRGLAGQSGLSESEQALVHR